jgi:hypothetical protein
MTIFINFLRLPSTAPVLGSYTRIILSTSSKTLQSTAIPVFFFCFRRVHVVARSVYLALSCPSPAYISTAPTGRISLKFYVGDFCENLSRRSRFG